MKSLTITDWKKYMSNDNDEWMKRIQDQFDKLDENAQGTTTNELNE